MASISADIIISQLPSSTASDPATVTKLVSIINAVFTESSADMLVEGHLRTDFDELSAIVRAGEIHVATRGPEIVGCVRLCRIDETMACFGMLSVPAEHRKTKLGSRLVAYAEATAKEMGYRKMRVELLMPRHLSHEFRDFLKVWYMKIGYRLVRKDTVEEFLPHLVDVMVVPADFEIYDKDL